jgi:hypothetical protein
VLEISNFVVSQPAFSFSFCNTNDLKEALASSSSSSSSVLLLLLLSLQRF